MDEDRAVDQLVAAALDGDESAWGEIVDRYTPLLVSVVLRFRLSSGEVEDVAQTVWLRMLEHLRELREPRALPMWIITTARRESIRCLAAQQRTQPHDPLEDESWGRLEQDDDAEAEMVRAERHQALLAGLAVLNPRQRQVLVLLAEDPPISYAEISRRSGIPVGAIGPTRVRALNRLRRTPPVLALLSGLESRTPTRRRPA